MKNIILNNGYVAVVDDDDYDKCSAFKWSEIVAKNRDGSIRTVYARRNQKKNGKQHTIYLHRFILGITESKIEIDHRDGNGLNCSRSNMRKATRLQNLANMKRHRSNRSGHKGVSMHKQSGLWHATIQVNQRRISIGYFKTKEEAGKAYHSASRRYWGEFANEQS